MENALKNFNYSLISKGDIVAVALSGGKDSVALFFTLLEYSKTFPFTLKAINVEHGIRENSKNDSEFVKNLCKQNDVELLFAEVKAISFAKENKMTIETAARHLRYEFFDSLKKSGKVDYIALGHHKNDSVETTLFNIFRGSGIAGATSMKEKRDYFLRPMLQVNRSEIDDFIKGNNLSFVTDESNFDNDYSRNYIRNVIMPTILAKFPNALSSISRFSDNLKEDLFALDEIAKTIVIFDEKNHSSSILLKDMLYEALSVRAIFYALKLIDVTHEVYSKNLADIITLTTKENGKRIDLTDNVTCYKDYDKLVFERKNKIESVAIAISTNEFSFGGMNYHSHFVEKFEKMPFSLAIDFDKLPQNAIIRNRQDGDVFLRCSGKVKLKEYLIDKKIPSRLRDKLLFIASDNLILAALTFECGKPLLVSDDTKRILLFTSKEKEI